MSTRVAFVLSLAGAVAVIGGYLVAGGGDYRPLELRDPCEPRPVEDLRAGGALAEQLALSALDGAACRLRVTREELALALATPEARVRFAREHHIGDEQIERALRAGLERAAADAQRSGRISALEAVALREALRRAPLSLLVDAVLSKPGSDIARLLEDLIAREVG